MVNIYLCTNIQYRAIFNKKETTLLVLDAISKNMKDKEPNVYSLGTSTAMAWQLRTFDF